MIVGDTFQAGGVTMTIDPEFMGRTLTAVESLKPEELKAICESYGQTIGKGQPLATYVMIVKSYVQNEWLQTFKGEIPMATQANHEGRQKKVAADATAAEGNGKGKAPKEAKAARAERSYGWAGKVADLEGMKGHQLLCATALKEVGKGNLADVIAQVKKGAEYKSKHDLETSVRGNLAAGVRKGWAKFIE